MKRFWHNNSLSIVLFLIFFLSIAGMSIAGWHTNNQELQDRGQTQQSYGAYITSGGFVEGVFENWESEFLQMWALVMLTIWLRQKGADDSKPIHGTMAQDTRSRYMLNNAKDWPGRWRAIRHFMYSHSFGFAALAIFIFSFILHAAGGAEVYNQDAAYYGDAERVNTFSYMGTSQFWYESLQNWQSEFLAVGTLMLLSISLRERGSPESKPVGKRYDKITGDG